MASKPIMTVSVHDARASDPDRRWIERVYRDYLDDLAPLDTGIFPALGEVGHREPDQVARWFGDPSACPLVIAKSAEPVGFAVVVRTSAGARADAAPAGARTGVASARAGSGAASYRMAEFFVSRASRGLGIGRIAAQLILDRFAGHWEIIEYMRNPGAVNFWRRVLSAYARGAVEERVVNGEVRQVLESGRGARPDPSSGFRYRPV
ncbi:MAG: GNAT family N-acetyltransferase [Steroidobacteraceae bacterium]